MKVSALFGRWSAGRHTVFRGSSVSRPLNPQALWLMAGASALLLSSALDSGVFSLIFWQICGIALTGRWAYRVLQKRRTLDTVFNCVGIGLLMAGVLLIVARPSLATNDLVPAVIGILLAIEYCKANRGQDLMGFAPPLLFLITRQLMVSETLHSTLVNIIVVVAMLTALSMSSESTRGRNWPFHLQRVLKVLLTTIPVVLVFFALFPRLPFGDDAVAPLGKPTLGLSRSMSPGNLSGLAKDAGAATAFTAQFEPGSLPAQLYWRALVMDRFDGQSWYETAATEPRLSTTPDPRLPRGAPGRRLTIDLPNSMLPYVPVLDILPAQSMRWSVEDGTFGYLMPDAAGVYRYIEGTHSSLRLNASVPDRRLDRLASQVALAPSERVGEGFPAAQGANDDQSLATALALPQKAASARVAQLARSMRASSGATNADPMPLVHAFSSMVYSGAYTYTLRPLAYGENSVDQLLFGARAGYCEHYASAFTVFMRLAGIPARVVTGYQGGEVDEATGQIRVAARSAHAWSEIWAPSTGWIRVDPTAFINPSNVDPEAAEFFRGTASELEGWSAMNQHMVDWLNGVNVGWNRWVLGFDASSQDSLFEKIGAPPALRSLIALAAIFFVIFSALATATLVRLWRDRRSVDPRLRELERLTAHLRALGLVVEPHATPQQIRDALDTCSVPGRLRENAAAARKALAAYESWRYGPVRVGGAQEVSRLLRLARRSKTASMRR